MNKLKWFYLSFLSLPTINYADSIAHYMSIAQNIPRMEMKADASAQTWARSARNVLLLTGESIWESLRIANELSQQKGTPLFCLPPDKTLSAEQMYDLIQTTYQKLDLGPEEQNQMSVAQVALKGLEENYPCPVQNQHGPRITIHQKGEGMAKKILHVSKI